MIHSFILKKITHNNLAMNVEDNTLLKKAMKDVKQFITESNIQRF